MVKKILVAIMLLAPTGNAPAQQMRSWPLSWSVTGADPIVAYASRKYVAVNALTTDSTGGIVCANGETIAVSRFRGNGASPDIYVQLVWDLGGGQEEIIVSTRGDIDHVYDTTRPENQFSCNGSRSLKIVIRNNTSSLAPIVGGEVEVVKL